MDELGVDPAAPIRDPRPRPRDARSLDRPHGIWGLEWARSPTILPATLIGLGTIVAPWFVMQPGMGTGIAASWTLDPRAARLRNIATNAAYRAGLYCSAVFLANLWT